MLSALEKSAFRSILRITRASDVDISSKHPSAGAKKARRSR